MKGFPKLTHKGLLKRHKKNPKDKSLHDVIETKKINKEQFNILIQQTTKQKPFDNKKNPNIIL